MAIISNFELLFKPIAPTAGPAAEIGRVVVQGYFLEISNLEERDIKLIFRTRTSVKDPSDAVNTEFTATNNSVVFDITADNVFETVMTEAGELIPNKQLGHYVNCIFIPAGQTASLAILPNVEALFASPTADLAIRGYTELVLSSDIASLNPLTFEAPEPARVLVSAEHRGTFVDPQFDPSDFATQEDLDFDQLAYSLNTANGNALQFLKTHAPFNAPFNDGLTKNALSSDNLDALVGLPPLSSVSATDLSAAGLSSISQSLFRGANSPSRIFEFTFANVPVRLSYEVVKGKYQVEPKSTIKALDLIMRRNNISQDGINLEKLVGLINKALAGDKEADAVAMKVLGGIL